MYRGTRTAGLIVLATAHALAAPAAAASIECSLNGVLDRQGACACDKGWRGGRCQSLNLAAPDPAHSGYLNASMPSWGGDAIFSDGAWHLFATVKADLNSPYDNYDCNTAIARLEGQRRDGPFEFREVVLDCAMHLDAHMVPYIWVHMHSRSCCGAGTTRRTRWPPPTAGY